MTKVRVSSRYQIVIPRKIREGLSLRPGQDMQVFRKGKVIMLVPDRRIGDFRGILRGVPTTGFRDKNDRL
jgi:AbrB family looped-hinge helix DNA binding protein